MANIPCPVPATTTVMSSWIHQPWKVQRMLFYSTSSYPPALIIFPSSFRGWFSWEDRDRENKMITCLSLRSVPALFWYSHALKQNTDKNLSPKLAFPLQKSAPRMSNGTSISFSMCIFSSTPFCQGRHCFSSCPKTGDTFGSSFIQPRSICTASYYLLKMPSTFSSKSAFLWCVSFLEFSFCFFSLHSFRSPTSILPLLRVPTYQISTISLL